jgi:hypothetical protein
MKNNIKYLIKYYIKYIVGVISTICFAELYCKSNYSIIFLIIVGLCLLIDIKEN